MKRAWAVCRMSVLGRGRSTATLARSSGALSLAIHLVFATGCAVSDPGGGNGDPTNGGGTTDPVSAQVVNISATGVPLSLQDPLIAVIYEVTGTVSTISGFYQPVADGNPQAGPIGDRVIVATFLPPRHSIGSAIAFPWIRPVATPSTARHRGTPTTV